MTYLFKYATKELSQDAFFCWLLDWADKKYIDNEMNKISKHFIYSIIGEEKEINTVEVKKQYKNIDFLVRINENILIVFEDKVKTSEHDKQLERYKEKIEKEYPLLENDKKYFVYIKSDLVFPKEKNYVEKSGFQVIDIYNILDLLGTNEVKNDIYKDFIYCLKYNVKEYKNFLETKYCDWTRNNFYGFIYNLIKSNNLNYIDHGAKPDLYFILAKLDYPINYSISLEIIYYDKEQKQLNLLIVLHFNDNEQDNNLEVRNDLQKKLKNIFNNENLEYNERDIKSDSKRTRVITFKDFPKINSEGFIDYQETENLLVDVIKKFEKISNS